VAGCGASDPTRHGAIDDRTFPTGTSSKIHPYRRDLGSFSGHLVWRASLSG